MNQNDDKKVALAKDYKKNVEEELTALCETVLSLLKDHLIPNAKEIESQVLWFYCWSYYRLIYRLSFVLSTVFCRSYWASDYELLDLRNGSELNSEVRS